MRGCPTTANAADQPGDQQEQEQAFDVGILPLDLADEGRSQVADEILFHYASVFEQIGPRNLLTQLIRVPCPVAFAPSASLYC